MFEDVRPLPLVAPLPGIAPAGLGETSTRFARDHALLLIGALGLAMRLMLLATPRSYFPDQVFQYLEPAHRLVFGSGIVTWEYRYGIRSWLMPLALAVPMQAGAWLSPDGQVYLLLPKLMLVAVSLVAIAAAAAIGARCSRLHACLAAFVAATWCEYALFATQALTEALAIPLFLAAAGLLAQRQADTPVRLASAGALLALTSIVRFQYGPAVAIYGLIACGWDARRWLWIAVGAGAALAASGVIDAAVGQVPFEWLVANLRENLARGRSTSYSADGPFFYPYMMVATWGAWLLPIGVLAALGARRQPALMVCALANIAAHTLIVHKEYRFILLSMAILVLLAAIGTADVVETIAARRGAGRRRLVVLAAFGWCTASLSVATAPSFSQPWQREKPGLDAFAYLHGQPRLCGVALTGLDWVHSGGQTYLHRRVPIYLSDVPGPVPEWIRQNGAGFDTVVATRADGATMPAPYALDRCFSAGAGDACIYRRPGPCDAAAAAHFEINKVLARLDR